MSSISSNYNIETNRGDVLVLDIKSKNKDGSLYTFQTGDVVRFKIMEKKNCDNVIVQKDAIVDEPMDTVRMTIPSEEMKIGDLINKPVDYWYEIELNPDTSFNVTILGYTQATGPRILTLTPEGGDKK